MAFVKIYKNGKTITVPMGAYNRMYASAGWVLEDSSTPKSLEKSGVEESSDRIKKSERAIENEAKMVSEEKDETFEDEELEELEERPLSELTVPELRVLAESKGIDVTGLTSAKKLKDAIKNA